MVDAVPTARRLARNVGAMDAMMELLLWLCCTYPLITADDMRWLRRKFKDLRGIVLKSKILPLRE